MIKSEKMKKTIFLIIVIMAISLANVGIIYAQQPIQAIPTPTPPSGTPTPPTPVPTNPVPTQTASPTPIPTPTPTPVPTTPAPTSTPTPTQTTQNIIIIKEDNEKDSGISSLAGSTVLSLSLANVDPNPPIAGDAVDIRIGIRNTGGEAISNLMMEVIPEYPFTLVSGESATKTVGIVEGYQSDDPTANLKIIKYKFKIDKDASEGIYELKVKYYESGTNDFVTKILYIDIKSRTNVEIIHVDKTTLVPGTQNSLKFTINNVGNAPLRDVTFNWENKDNVILPVGSDNTRYIKYIDISQGFDIEYQVIADTNANPGLYKLGLYLTYTDSVNGTRQQFASSAGVYVGGETDFDISLSDIASSETSFSVANTGSNPAYAVLIVVPRQNGWKVTGPNSVMIGNLNSGDYTSTEFKLQRMKTKISSNSSSEMSEILVRVSYTDTMGKRKIVEKNVEVEQLQDITTTDEVTPKQRQGNPLYILIIIIIVLFIASAYRKYGQKKLVDPDLKMWDMFRPPRKKKFG